MKKLISTLILTFIILTGYGQETGKNFIDQNYIEVTGHADNEVVPDKIFLKFFINEKDFKNQTLSEVEAKMIQKLKEIGIDVDKKLAVKDFVSNFQNYWILKPDIRLIKEYELLVNDAKTAGTVFLEFEKIGISSISIDKLENSEIDKYELEVKVKAMKSAQEKAKAIATSINQDIGRAILIQENPNFVRVENAIQGRVAGIQIRGVSSLKKSSSVGGANIEFEKIKLEYNIIARFELK
ncbi:SIMPL domain-containing protein [Labilibaculum sp.]|uniref:SIMPL domain-containing protein n=1 Tax=Labilibaculum sp. TaxID=2060723 RepID=UPI002AA5FD71|nr:SIMPL domain-containing protein [Labilibaculum sp.]